jgi:predicted DsbA family dithiol-disulfide isomerase
MSSTIDPATSAAVEVTEFTDPGCVWSWSSEPILRWLRYRYGERVRWRRVLGIQIDDLGEAFPDRDPVASAEEFRAGWLEVAAYTGAPITERLEWMHRSTRPAARAVKAAELQGDAVAAATLRRLREAVFVLGRPADDEARIAAVLDGTPELDVERLLAELGTPAVVGAVQDDYVATRRPRDEVIGLTEPGPHPGAARSEGGVLRYAFPTLVLRGPVAVGDLLPGGVRGGRAGPARDRPPATRSGRGARPVPVAQRARPRAAHRWG